MKAVVLKLSDEIADDVARLIASTLMLNGYRPDEPAVIDWPEDRPQPVGFGDDPTPGFEHATWRIAAKLIGGHVHVKIRHGRAGSRANCGTIVLREEEWPSFEQHWTGADITYEVDS